MKLEEVLPYLREGKKIRREYYKKFPSFFHQLVNRDGIETYNGNGLLSVFELVADDWEVVQ